MAVLLAVSGGIWYWSGKADRTNERENQAALKDVVYRVRCTACNETFEMPAVQYAAERGPEGVRCPKCGQQKGWRIGDASEVDPATFADEASKLATVSDVRAARDVAQAEFDAIEIKLAAPDAAGNPEQRAELRKQKARLRAKLQAFDHRWDELTSK